MRALTAPRRRVGVLSLIVAAAAVGAAFGGAQAASAHDSLVSATPAADATVSTASDVELTFSANLLGADGGNEVIVVGPDARHYETDCTALAGPVLTTPVELGAAGEYQVTWRAVSSDGHPVSGTYAFTYAPDAGQPVSEGSETSPCASVAAQQDSTDATAPAPAPSGLVIGLSVGGLAIIVVGVVVVLLVRPRRKGDADDE
ncbi:copper resistance protein CopC [Microbacterium enclense]|uniref:copper resistance CopC family protein n=1 Tax=Microbacterium enclense TaxID=993073 RepID=UPI001F0C3020|nr:copper resistance CopC family protein [Microbacterium enclense]MCT2087178.1 copper resistance protein CopC [Microbacterium enclense]